MKKLSSDKRILIAGSGAIGSFYGGLMTRAGYNVELYARGPHLNAMQSTGKLFIDSHKHGELEIDVNAVAKPEGIYDIIFICVKSQGTAEMAAKLKDNLSPDGCIVSFQNGVENPDILASVFGEERVIGASLFIGLAINTPGKATHSGLGNCIFGAWCKDSEKYIPILQEIFDKSEITASSSDDIRYVLWYKLVWNVGFNPLSALLGSTCGPMAESEIISPLMENMVKEVVAAAKMHGVTITEEEWRKKLKVYDYNFKTSMLQDIEHLRSPEIDGILGPVIRTHEKNGLKAPYCETVYRTLEFKYGRHFIYTPRLTVDMIVRKGDEILLIERLNEPHGWAIPGGFVDYGETVEHAAVRELSEETGIEADEIHMLGVYSDPQRDKRGHNVSVVYYTDTDQDAKAADDAKNAVFFKVNDLPDNIVFDHKKIINEYLLKIQF